VTFSVARPDGTSYIAESTLSTDDDLTENDLPKVSRLLLAPDKILGVVEFEKASIMKQTSPSDVIVVMIYNVGLEFTPGEYQAYIDAGAVEEDIFNFVSQENYQNYHRVLDEMKGSPTKHTPLSAP
jgi:hypothetical protein